MFFSITDEIQTEINECFPNIDPQVSTYLPELQESKLDDNDDSGFSLEADDKDREAERKMNDEFTKICMQIDNGELCI